MQQWEGFTCDCSMTSYSGNQCNDREYNLFIIGFFPQAVQKFEGTLCKRVALLKDSLAIFSSRDWENKEPIFFCDFLEVILALLVAILQWHGNL